MSRDESYTKNGNVHSALSWLRFGTQHTQPRSGGYRPKLEYDSQTHNFSQCHFHSSGWKCDHFHHPIGKHAHHNINPSKRVDLELYFYKSDYDDVNRDADQCDIIHNDADYHDNFSAYGNSDYSHEHGNEFGYKLNPVNDANNKCNRVSNDNFEPEFGGNRYYGSGNRFRVLHI